MRTKTLSIIVPAYNEEKLIGKTVTELNELLKFLMEKMLISDFEILVCDNNSTDNTGKICKTLEKKISELRYVFLPKKGYGVAMKAGIRLVKNELITHAAGDGEFDANFIERAIKESEEYDFIIGSKHLNKRHVGASRFRDFLSAGFSFLTKISLKTTDLGSVVLFKRDFCEKVKNKLKSNDFRFQIELYYYALVYRQKIKEIQITPKITRVVSSKLNVLRDGTRLGLSCLYYGAMWRIKRVIDKFI